MNLSFDNLIGQMTVEEKAAMLAGIDTWRTVPIERLNIPSVQVSDGPNGARGADDNIGGTSVCVPCGIALGATWNLDLVQRIGGLLAKEVRAKDAHVLLAPTVNIHRTPIAGRNFECYSEDPFLSGKLAAAYIRGLQSNGIGATIKHYVCNDQEFERHSISAEVADRPLHEIYLEPFRIAVEESEPWAIMSAYNRINGTFASEHDYLLKDLLKGEWGYTGVVMSDWYGTYSHDTPAGGLDLEMPGPARYMDVEKIVESVRNGELDEAVLDEKIGRLLTLIERVGAFGEREPAEPVDTPEDRQLAREAAAEAIVLLKNEANLLPLDPNKAQKIAIIGENGNAIQIMGGGSAQVNAHYAVSPLKAIRERVGETAEVEYHIGQPLHRLPPEVDHDWIMTKDGTQSGLTLEFFDNLTLDGDPSRVDRVNKTNLTWFGTVNPYVDTDNFSMRLEGTITVPEDGEYVMHLWSIGQARMWVDGELIVDHWQRDAAIEADLMNVFMNIPEGASKMTAYPIELKGGVPAVVKMEYATEPNTMWRTLRLGMIPPLPDNPLEDAVQAAAAADVAIVVAGLTFEWEGEGGDRPDMDMVRNQNELIARVAEAQPNTIVALNVGSPVTMPWLDAVPAVLQMWYPGQEAGHALSDILFGDVSPSGKLPLTLPQRLEDNPAYINYPGENGKVHYGEGIFVGYRYYEKKRIDPLFVFGHGLSYSTFELANARLNQASYRPEDTIQIEVDLTNTGDVAAQEVVQAYVHMGESKLVRPEKELKAFEKVSLQPGETRTVQLTLSERALAQYDPAQAGWVTQPGRYEVRLGRSSADIVATVAFEFEA